MCGRVTGRCYPLWVVVLTTVALAPAQTAEPSGPSPGDGDGPVDPPTFFLCQPWSLEVATLDDEIDAADITDVEVADFNGDGREDIAVAWYATDLDDTDNNLRTLSVYFGSGTGSFAPAAAAGCGESGSQRMPRDKAGSAFPLFRVWLSLLPRR